MSAHGDMAAAGVTLDLDATPSDADIDLIERNLTAFNESRSLPDDRRPLCVFVRDGGGIAIGGATGHSRWGWLYVDCFWLPAEARHSGLGGDILRLMEAEAVRRGCTRSCLFTYSFQARGFYERHGYAVFGIQEDYPPAITKSGCAKRSEAS